MFGKIFKSKPMHHILCFGDSLTEGMVCGPPLAFHPYSLKLEEKLKSGGYKFTVCKWKEEKGKGEGKGDYSQTVHS